MEKDLKDLERLIFGSNLSVSDKRAFFAFLKNGKDDEVRKIASLFEEYPAYIEIVYRFAVLKSDASEKQDEKAFKKIIEEEISFLEKI